MHSHTLPHGCARLWRRVIKRLQMQQQSKFYDVPKVCKRFCNLEKIQITIKGEGQPSPITVFWIETKVHFFFSSTI